MAKAARTRTGARAAAEPPRRYQHRQETAGRPEIGAAPRFTAKAAPATYRYDSSLPPALELFTIPPMLPPRHAADHA